MKAFLQLEGTMEIERTQKGAAIVRYMGGDMYLPAEIGGFALLPPDGELKKLKLCGGIKKGNFCLEFRATEVIG